MNKEEFEECLKKYGGNEVTIMDMNNKNYRTKLYHTIRKSRYGYLILKWSNSDNNVWENGWEEAWISPENILEIKLIESVKK